MPLLRKQPFVPMDLPADLKPDEEVFMNPLTKEIFRNYEDYFRRSILCNSLLWSCEYTGRSNLTLAEALKSETDAAEHLDRMPLALQQAICFIIHKGQVSSLTSFVNEVLSFYRERYLPGEEVEISDGSGKGSSCTGVIQDVILDEGAVYHQPSKIEYRCVVVDTGEIIQAGGNQVSRRKHQLTRERVKLLVKCSAKKITTEPALYVVKQEHIERLKLDENYTVPYIGDYGKPNPNSAKRKKDVEGAPGEKKRKKEKKPSIEMTEEAIRLMAEERRKLIEEERNRKKRERQEEKELQRKMQIAEQAFLKEWMRPREDLELTDSKELPVMRPPQTVLDNSLYGDLIQVSEFFWLFGEHVNFTEEFPQGIAIGDLDKSLAEQKRGGLFGQLVIFLLKLVFALQEEEEEEEKKYAEKYNFTYIEPTLNESVAQMKPRVTWEDTVPRTSERSLWAGPAAAFYFTLHYTGVPLSKLQLDEMTVTEILRLFILGVGGRSGGTQYSGKWRFNHRGMYSDTDSPCLEMRQKEEGLLKLLRVSNIFDLPASSKLTILTTLINEVLSFAQFREIIEEALENGREAWRDWKSFGQEVQRKEREEAAQKYKEWLASRIKLKEEKKNKGRLTELQGCSDTGEQSDNCETDTSLNLDASQVEESKEKEEAREEEKEATEAQDHTLYVAFKELCHKVKTRPLGTDRYFRRYWSFFSTPGIFVERSSVDIEKLYQRTVDLPPTPPPQTTQNADIDEFVQKKLKEESDKHGPTAETYEQLLQTPGFGFLTHRDEMTTSWWHLSSEDDIRALVSSLNPRGERESTLIENIAGDIGRIIARIAEDEQAEEGRTREKSGDDVAKILETATSEKLMEATVREDLCDLENRIVEAGFGHGVPDRLVWRSRLEDFRLTQEEEDDERKVQTSPDTIAQLREALLQIQEALPVKYLAPPLTAGGKDVPGKLEGWREVTSQCSSLSQIVIHLYTLDGCISWKKSALRASCRVCRRKCDPEKLLLCDSCDRGQHLYCMKPKLRSIPPGEWHCAVCRPPPPPRQKRSKKQRNGWSDEEGGEDGEEEVQSTRRSSSRGGTKKMADSEKLKLGQKILVEMQENENGWPFLYPVDGNEVPEYYTIIPNPMDLSTIERKFRTNRYRKFDTYLEDVELIFLNCIHFNTSKAPAHKAGVKLQKLFHQRLDEYDLR